MADDITAVTVAAVSTTEEQIFNTLFGTSYTVTATLDQTSVIAAAAELVVDCAATGVVLGDMIIGMSLNKDISDGVDIVNLTAHVTAAGVITVVASNPSTELAANTLTGTIKFLVGRPTW